MVDDDQDEHLCSIALLLGKFPEPWWSTTWEGRKAFFKDDADVDGWVVDIKRNTDLNTNRNEGAQDEHIVM